VTGGCGVDVGDEDLFTLFNGFESFDVELLAVEADCGVVVAAVVD
jgi:hypothetical protein